MKFSAIPLLCAVFVPVAAQAEEPNVNEAAVMALGLEGVELKGLDLEKDEDRKLFAFCIGALLRVRGLTCSTFGGSSDQAILTYHISNPRFLELLNESQVSSIFKGDPLPKRAGGSEDSTGPPEGIAAHYQRTNDRLMAKLTAEQRERLPGVYLHMEGLLALCRPDFAKVFEDLKSQERIREIADEEGARANLFHRTLFVQDTLDEAPFLESGLRRVSFDLDLRIAKLLTQTERKRLVQVLARASGFETVIHGTPPY